MNHIDIYNNSAIILNKKTPKKVISWITILSILIIILIILFSIPFNIYKTYNGYITIEKETPYLILMVTVSDFPINKTNTLYIKKDKYDYEIIDVEEDKIVLKVNLKDEIKIEGNIVTLNILKDRTTVFNILKNKIKRGACI